MISVNKSLSLVLVCMLTISSASLLMVKPANAQTIPAPSLPEFTVNYVGHPYEVQPTISTDPYTGENTTVPGYYVSNATIELSIKNQPFNSHGTFSLYYEVRSKGHFGEDWTIQQTNIYTLTTEEWSSPLGIKPSTSEYTVIEYPADYTPNSQIDFQVAALLYNDTSVFYSDHPLAPPPINQVGHYELHPTLFSTTDWSPTQTITIPASSVSPTPTVPEFPAIAILPLVLSLPLVGAMLRKRKVNLD